MFPSTPLYLQAGVTTRQISAENPTGAKNSGCMWEPDPTNPDIPYSGASLELGRGWKVRPFIKLMRQTTVEIADIEGPGCINQIFLTCDAPCSSEIVVRIYWDGETAPSVECPLGAFFAMGFDRAVHTVYSSMVTVAPQKGLNCYWQMPFRKRTRITVTNDSTAADFILAYKVLYKLHGIPDGVAYFHAQYRRSLISGTHPEHTILDGVRGCGLYVGTYMALNAFCGGWWGEGEVKFWLDGDENPSIADNGTEDYFGGAWSFYDDMAGGETVEQAFCSPYLGMPLAKTANQNGPRKFGLYRWHILDSIGFREDLRATVQSLSWYPNGSVGRVYRPVPLDIATVAYWYQTEPHTGFPKLPDAIERYDL